MDSKLKEPRIDGATAYDGSFLKIARDQVSLPDGATTFREYIQHPGAVVVLAILDDGSVLLERQFRYPLRRVFIRSPGRREGGSTAE